MVFSSIATVISTTTIDIMQQPIYESAHNKTYNKALVTSKDSDQPVHPPSMARVLLYPSLDNLKAVEAHAISEDSDQTARMRRLI